LEKEKVISLLEEIKKYFELLSRKIEELDLILREGEEEPPPNLRAKLKVLWKVKERGGIIDKDELLKYWVSLGKNSKGFGSLFQGYGKLITIAGNKVALSPEAEELIKDYEDWLRKNA
jgi:hypothetical protein